MEPPREIVAKDGVCDVEWILPEGSTLESWSGRAPDLLVEIPHGATRKVDYDRLRARLSPSLPDDLIDFFFVNTDVGAPEYGREVARQVVCGAGAGDGLGAAGGLGAGSGLSADDRLGAPGGLGAASGSGAAGGLGAPDGLGAAGGRALLALVIRCLLPRTFIDTNRVADDGSSATERTDLNAAISEYVRDPRDVELLLSLHRSYHEVADCAFDWVCGAGGLALAPHTYAPRSIQIDDFDEGIGRAIRAAYEPDRYETWKPRPPVDLITLGPDGRDLAPRGIVDAIRARYAELDVETAENDTYRLHPSTMAYRYAERYPGQVLCVELRRDLLAEPFSPFAEMRVPGSRAQRMAGPIAQSLREALLARS